MTVVVIGLDAADYRLIDRWDISSLKLDHYQTLETESYTFEDKPHTQEIWPTIATGATPEEHGVRPPVATDKGHGTWGNPVLNRASRWSSYVIPSSIRSMAGDVLLNRGAKVWAMQRNEEIDHVFDAVYEWPGITPVPHVETTRNQMTAFTRGNIDYKTFVQDLWQNTGDEVGWLLGHVSEVGGIIGTQMHVLDSLGHVHADNEIGLRRGYERMGSFVDLLCEHADDVVIVSDHGMQVDWFGDSSVADHSYHAYIASTSGLPNPLPSHIEEVASWLDSTGSNKPSQPNKTSAVTEEQLEALGYT